MYAVIRTGGKQYRVEQDDVLDIEKVRGEVGETFDIEEVLLVRDGESIKIGQPLVEGARVSAEIVEQTREKKVLIFKKLRRQGKQLKKGHRQPISSIRITGIHH